MAKTNNSTYEVIRKMRGDWGDINPVTKIIPNKKKNYRFDDDYYSMDDCCYDLEHHHYEEDWGDY